MTELWSTVAAPVVTARSLLPIVVVAVDATPAPSPALAVSTLATAKSALAPAWPPLVPA